MKKIYKTKIASKYGTLSKLFDNFDEAFAHYETLCVNFEEDKMDDYPMLYVGLYVFENGAEISLATHF